MFVHVKTDVLGLYVRGPVTSSTLNVLLVPAEELVKVRKQVALTLELLVLTVLAVLAVAAFPIILVVHSGAPPAVDFKTCPAVPTVVKKVVLAEFW